MHANQIRTQIIFEYREKIYTQICKISERVLQPSNEKDKHTNALQMCELLKMDALLEERQKVLFESEQEAQTNFG